MRHSCDVCMIFIAPVLKRDTVCHCLGKWWRGNPWICARLLEWYDSKIHGTSAAPSDKTVKFHIRSVHTCENFIHYSASTVENKRADINPVIGRAILWHSDAWKSHAWRRKGSFSSKAVCDISVKGVHLTDPLKGRSSSCKIDVCNKNKWPCSVFYIF
jgi:hypothetical protein